MVRRWALGGEVPAETEATAIGDVCLDAGRAPSAGSWMIGVGAFVEGACRLPKARRWLRSGWLAHAELWSVGCGKMVARQRMHVVEKTPGHHVASWAPFGIHRTTAMAGLDGALRLPLVLGAFVRLARSFFPAAGAAPAAPGGTRHFPHPEQRRRLCVRGSSQACAPGPSFVCSETLRQGGDAAASSSLLWLT